MPESNIELFSAITKAILAGHASGTCSVEHAEVLQAGRKLIHKYIVTFIEKDGITLPYVKKALLDLNQGIDYDTDLAIRALADVCRTLQRLADGKQRKQSDKILEAKQLFLSLSHFAQQ